ncbi:MAG TPA: ATP-dependent DNA helicase RecG [Candidatus Dormibacteraeota bacterium]|nr:ATP-dependent DNA helicase RecG [Candidatus Dormibacteraeota bacterium]
MGSERRTSGDAVIGRQSSRGRTALPRVPLSLDSPVTRLPRITAADVKGLRKLRLHTVRDLLLELPYDWESYGAPVPIAELPLAAHATALVTVIGIQAKRSRIQDISLTEAVVADDRGSTMKVVWFHQPYRAHQLRPGDRIALAGKVRASRYGGLEMQNPHTEVITDQHGPGWVGGLMPKYHLTGKLTSRKVAMWVDVAMPLAGELDDEIPEHVRRSHHLLPLAEAVRLGHQPATAEDWRRARERMAFAELMEFQAAFLMARRRIAVERATPIPYQQDVIDTFKAGLGFELTRAQKRAMWDAYKDMRQDVPMNRLLNGDVGSGKTAVAAAAAAMAHASGLQTVVMAPTEILARQHLDKFRAYLEPSFPGLSVELLISDLPAPERRRVRMSAASGLCALLVGTHALIEEEVQLASLGLAVVDEQHRFGTRQRELLRQKSATGRPHFMAMTATPIPRSLALALYGEMTFSVIDEMPPGRTPVRTDVVAPEDRQQAYDLVRREVRGGRQAFVICPLIEESEKLMAKAATAEFERLRTKVFPDLRLALVHGKMKDKDAVMRAFRGRESEVLVATSVVEVGIDVPNATVMLVEGADRFGLAQLHQLRGRVGRAAHRSHCLLLADDPSNKSLARLRLVAETSDGFRLAQEDMNLRGMGELLGPRQHGISDQAMESLQNPELLSEVRQEAEALAAADPDLARWPALWRAAERRLEQTSVT